MTAQLLDYIFIAEAVVPDFDRYGLQGANVIVLTQDNRTCLQRRDENIWSHSGALSFWGGGVDPGESFAEAAARELREELSASLSPASLIFSGAHTRYSEERKCETLASRFFWHDRDGKIGQCTEGTPEYFTFAAVALADPKLHPGTRWALQECVRRGLIPA